MLQYGKSTQIHILITYYSKIVKCIKFKYIYIYIWVQAVPAVNIYRMFKMFFSKYFALVMNKIYRKK